MSSPQSKKALFDRVVAELHLDTSDPFTLLFANACALADQRDVLAERIRTLTELLDAVGRSPRPICTGEHDRNCDCIGDRIRKALSQE